MCGFQAQERYVGSKEFGHVRMPARPCLLRLLRCQRRKMFTLVKVLMALRVSIFGWVEHFRADVRKEPQSGYPVVSVQCR